MSHKVRIGIDVGGTFTDAVVIDNATYEVVAKAKIPTTHDAPEGVAKGIVEVVKKVMDENGVRPEDVTFIAHGTTQATNALLEGDVARVGVLGMGAGLEGERARSETRVGRIELAPGKYLSSEHAFLKSDELAEGAIDAALRELTDRGAEVVVASKAYSVDDPADELAVIDRARALGIAATGGHEISQLYGLQARTRTAVVNAALIPKMLETANMTEESVRRTGITKPLMIMRCDGGVMSVDEVRKRPILTMLSGLAAGVAGALMYEKVTDGIFFEVGGTSIDISVIKDGKVMIKNAQVGGHKLYVTSLDVRTLGIAGGSMVIVEDGAIADVGPRSAHIAQREYEVFQPTEALAGASVRLVAPRPEDPPHYAVVSCAGGEFALTLAGAANLLGYVPDGDHAEGNREAARVAWEALGREVGMDAEQAARRALDIACDKVAAVVEELIREYELNRQLICFVGGGGSASVIPPYLGERMGVSWRIASNAPYISTIGVALALVREQIERNVANPTQDDVKRIRSDAFDAVVQSGANPDTVEVAVEVDGQRNILRAIATGATELRTKDLAEKDKDPAELERIALSSVRGEGRVTRSERTGRWNAYLVETRVGRFFGLVKCRRREVRVLDGEGVIRLQKGEGDFTTFPCGELERALPAFVEAHTSFSDAGAIIPKVRLYFRQRAVDLSGVNDRDQLMALAQMECDALDDSTQILAVATHE